MALSDRVCLQTQDLSWKDIEGYEGLYKIRLVDNEFGCEVMSLKSGRYKNRERLLKPWKGKNGYYDIVLYKYEGEYEKFYLHHLIAKHFIENHDNLKYVDHIDNNRKNNNILNLRWCTSSQNNQNRTKKQNTSSKYIGVCRDKRNNKYYVQIYVNGNKIHLGRFKIEEEAALQYDEYARHYFGPQAKTNFNFT